MSRTVEYVLRNRFTGRFAMHVHQDDIKCIVVADSIGDLIFVAADWADMAEGSFVKELCGEPDADDDYCLANYEIVAREVRVRYLVADELVEFKKQKECWA